ncbi:MAG TPA: glycosyltransferase family 4 protein [Phycisphaerales bacterium]|nr:glycosyltransferase family 4 protein [Phycisphaerales bacterium]
MDKVALITLSAPYEKRPLSAVYTPHQANAIGASGKNATCEIFVVSMSTPRWLEKLIPKARAFNERPDNYVYQGATFHTVRGYFPHPVALRWRLSPRFPRFASRLITWSIEMKLERRLREEGVTHLLIHDGIMLGPMGRRLARKLNLPWGIIEHDPIDLAPDTVQGRYYTRYATNGARVIFTVGAPWLSHMTGALGLKQTRLVSNGTPLPAPHHWTTPRPDKWKGKKIVLCVGGYLERKAHTMLIRAFHRANVPDSHLVIVGQPPDHVRRVAEQTRAGEPSRVEFLDHMSHDGVMQHMVWADLFALPSWWESFGLVYAEAMAGETPVIMTTDCGMTHYIKHGVHGWIIPHHDEDALVNALTEALTTADLKAMGKAGREMVERRLTWRNNALQILAGLRGEPEPKFE